MQEAFNCAELVALHHSIPPNSSRMSHNSDHYTRAYYAALHGLQARALPFTRFHKETLCRMCKRHGERERGESSFIASHLWTFLHSLLTTVFAIIEYCVRFLCHLIRNAYVFYYTVNVHRGPYYSVRAIRRRVQVDKNRHHWTVTWLCGAASPLPGNIPLAIQLFALFYS